jgi:hypothetical protein
MTGAILPGNSTVVLKDFDIPIPMHGEVLIKMKSSTIYDVFIMNIWAKVLRDTNPE